MVKASAPVAPTSSAAATAACRNAVVTSPPVADRPASSKRRCIDLLLLLRVFITSEQRHGTLLGGNIGSQYKIWINLRLSADCQAIGSWALGQVAGRSPPQSAGLAAVLLDVGSVSP